MNLENHRQVLVALNGDYTGDPNLIFLGAECCICSALFCFLAYLADCGTHNYHPKIFFAHKHNVSII